MEEVSVKKRSLRAVALASEMKKRCEEDVLECHDDWSKTAVENRY